MFRRTLFAFLLFASTAAAGIITIDFTPRGDGLIAIPTWMTYTAATNQGTLSNTTSTAERRDTIDFRFRAGTAPLSIVSANFFGDIGGDAIVPVSFTSSGVCDVTEITAGGLIPFNCRSDDGTLGVVEREVLDGLRLDAQLFGRDQSLGCEFGQGHRLIGEVG